jgi:hypothetical protein
VPDVGFVAGSTWRTIAGLELLELISFLFRPPRPATQRTTLSLTQPAMMTIAWMLQMAVISPTVTAVPRLVAPYNDVGGLTAGTGAERAG